MGHRRSRSPQWQPSGHSTRGSSPRRLKPAVWIGILAAMVVWSLIAWLTYLAVDPVLAWLSSSAGTVLEGSRDVVSAIGGKPAADAVGAVSSSGLIGQLATLLHAIAKPAIVIVWVLGMLGLIAAPMILTWMARAGR